jgi:ribokinase
MSEKRGIAILGVFVADLAFRAGRMPAMGETIFGSGFKLGPGGKGSNQAVAAARLGTPVTFISRLGADDFARVARQTWEREGIVTRVAESADRPTGAAFIFVDENSGDNAIIVVAGAAGQIGPADVEAAADAIRSAAVFVTQLEQPAAAAERGLAIAREAGTLTVLNPAPAAPVPDSIYALCDYVTPNEHEASLLTGIAVTGPEEARNAADVFLARGAGAAVVTLGSAGALLHSRHESVLLPAFRAGPVVETTGAGDAFNGGFAAALARGASPIEAVRFGCAVAGISVTRAGTAPSMPSLPEVEALLEASG